MLVCINPAHLMSTPGKCTPPDNKGFVIHECQQNYPIAFELVRQLNHNGIDTVLTNDNMYKELPSGGANADMYDRIHFEQKSGCDLYVSLHKNASASYEWDDIRGSEVHIVAVGGNAEIAAEYILKHVTEETDDKDRGVKVSNLAEVRETYAPAVLCELGFMTNKQDASRMLDNEWHYKYACAVAHGVCDYFGVVYDKMPKEDIEMPVNGLYKAELQAIHDNMLALCDDMQKIIDKL